MRTVFQQKQQKHSFFVHFQIPATSSAMFNCWAIMAIYKIVVVKRRFFIASVRIIFIFGPEFYLSDKILETN